MKWRQRTAASVPLTMADKNSRRKQASKQLERLLEEQLANFTPTEQARMHDRFEKRVSNRRDSDAKTPPPLRVGTR
jgi:hypothetical protein